MASTTNCQIRTSSKLFGIPSKEIKAHLVLCMSFAGRLSKTSWNSPSTKRHLTTLQLWWLLLRGYRHTSRRRCRLSRWLQSSWEKRVRAKEYQSCSLHSRGGMWAVVFLRLITILSEQRVTTVLLDDCNFFIMAIFYGTIYFNIVYERSYFIMIRDK